MLYTFTLTRLSCNSIRQMLLIQCEVVLQLKTANAFNSVSRRFMFQKLGVASGDIIQLIPFVFTFNLFEFFLFTIMNFFRLMSQ